MKTAHAEKDDGQEAKAHVFGVMIVLASTMAQIQIRKFLVEHGSADVTSLAMAGLISLAIYAIGVQKMMTASAQLKPSKARWWIEAFLVLMLSFANILHLFSGVMPPVIIKIMSHPQLEKFAEAYSLAIVFLIMPSIVVSVGAYYLATKFRASEAKRFAQN